jgi:hypothetical protein
LAVRVDPVQCACKPYRVAVAATFGVGTPRPIEAFRAAETAQRGMLRKGVGIYFFVTV